uniref:Zinc finger ZPR1-type domain-containing protein n=1 Tax=Bartheletia paradoxa TaxID=669517 RepID=A0A2D0XI34_9BASI|nr:hypothetical protein SPAR01987 [Bartheletia paradoxa]
MPAPTNFFPSIGALSEQTNAQLLPGEEGRAARESGDVAPGFHDAGAVEQIESLCLECGEQGMTRMLLTSIPYFREVVLVSFRCDHCGNYNNEIQSAGEIQPRGSLYTLKLVAASDLQRQLVKSASCTITIPELQLTIPPNRGQLTTVEGIMADIVRDLSMEQPVRKVIDPPTYEKIEALLSRLRNILGVVSDPEDPTGVANVPAPDSGDSDRAFGELLTIKMDDPAGNSFVEFVGGTNDPKWSKQDYKRNREQNVGLGLANPDEPAPKAPLSIDPASQEGTGTGVANEVEARKRVKEAKERARALREADTEYDIRGPEEVYSFPDICSSCGAELETYMKNVIIPYFKDILIMSTNCHTCGYRDNEVKSGGAISEFGKKISLLVEDEEDLSRDILKSETCGLEIPELDLLLHPGTLGGRFTTLEGLLHQVYDELSVKVFAGSGGDSGASAAGQGGVFESFLSKLKDAMSAKSPYTLILDDPLSNSYLQNIYAPDADPNMTIVTYTRSFDQNEELGLNDMNVEDYGFTPIDESALNGTNGGVLVPDANTVAKRKADQTDSPAEAAPVPKRPAAEGADAMEV